ncbi:NCS2 family permease [Methanococcus voltae]|uniref:AGZA family xanthine/uracil permease-like MFS transporter n=2 Tax=Methanococcus voltae TaxID=2188 RepID=A0A8J7URU7_METVO|nr:NCS2 family permease [Methanococcus voltae]MBP2172076.1 AGZA family xanthine/uracil permease-like MFS transporter [Methanococcus voltae]MBP2200967.1 AGZA family xanthine/uracil permease-like MFS transporter [Methanococcus voltae]MCS3921691.1 AGZA family xanthine/uracil permease-like MFS transporter [Methanococcus voltae PS]
MLKSIANYFEFEKYGTNYKTETMAGITTFMTMGYIIAVNPGMLSLTGMDYGAVLVATCVAAAISTFVMGVYAKYPFALAPGMGLNAYFTYSVCMGMGVDWKVALGAVFISGIVFILLTLAKVRSWIFNAIPKSLKYGTAVGIGLFITIIGLISAGIIVDMPATLIGLGDVRSPAVILALFGLLLIGVLSAKRVKGAILVGILLTAFLGMILGVSPFPAGIVSMPPDVMPTFLQMDVLGALNMGFVSIIFAFLFVDLFDTIGTLNALSAQAGYLDKEGKLPRVDKALMADSVGTSIGAIFGTSTVTSYVEAASGIGVGGRTGFAAVIVALLFLLSTFFYPVVSAIPGYATAPALIFVGSLMILAIKNIDLDDITEALPAFITIVGIPFTYSIANGLALGFISYPILKVFSGRYKEVHPLVYILALLFIIKFAIYGQ